MSSRKLQTEYLVALAAWSTNHAWIRAESADAAQVLAEDLWSKDESAFSYKDGGVDGISVLDSREVQS